MANRLRKKGLDHIVDHRCPSLQSKRITPHVLRHTCAMMILQATGDLRKVSLYASCLILVWASKNCQVIGNSDFEENVTRCSVTSGAM